MEIDAQQQFIARVLKVHTRLLDLGFTIEPTDAGYFAVYRDGELMNDCATLDHIEGFIVGFAIDLSVNHNNIETS